MFHKFALSEKSYSDVAEEAFHAKSLTLSETEKETVNHILEKYITLGNDTKVIRED